MIVTMITVIVNQFLTSLIKSKGFSVNYKEAGVDIGAAEQAVKLISTMVPNIGGFSGFFHQGEQTLYATTDGVGTKAEIAWKLGKFDTIGIDCVAMSVDDLVVSGATPLFFLDYISVGTVIPETIYQLVKGVKEGCSTAGCQLIGGEISEHPGMEGFDLVGFAVGSVEPGRQLPGIVLSGMHIVGISSPGLRCNGYSLARKALAKLDLSQPGWSNATRTLGEELLLPSIIYSPIMKHIVGITAAAHVTGGGIPGNLARILPKGLGAILQYNKWPQPRIFKVIQQEGDILPKEMEKVFNLGLGMLLIMHEEFVPACIRKAEIFDCEAWDVGTVIETNGKIIVS